MLKVSDIVVGPIATYRCYISEIADKKIDTYDIQGGGKQHLSLKLVGKDFLKTTLDDNNSECEQWFGGRIPDLISTDKSIIIKCGDTDPTKILQYFSRLEIEKIIIIPYPDPDVDTIKGYLFMKNKILDEYIVHKKECFISENKQYIKRYDKKQGNYSSLVLVMLLW